MHPGAAVFVAVSLFAQADAGPQRPLPGADGAPPSSGSSRNAPEQMPPGETREDERDDRTTRGGVNAEVRADLAGQSSTPTGVMYGTVIGPEMDSGAVHALGGALGAAPTR